MTTTTPLAETAGSPLVTAAEGTSHIMVTDDEDGRLWLACFAEGYSEMGDLIVQVEQGDSWPVLSRMVAAHLHQHGCQEGLRP